MAALLVPAGGIADRIGRKRVFAAGLALFVPASLVCALAPGWEVLVAGRALQGAGAAVIVGVSLALVLPEYPPERRASAVAVWGATAALAAAIGPALGGLLVEVGDWRWVFAANLPLGALVYVGARALTESKDEAAEGLPDLLGVALVIVGLGLLALGILEGGEWGWTSARIIAPFAVALVLLVVAFERCRLHPRPVIDPDLLRNRANLATLLLGMAFFSTILANIIFLTVVWDYSVLTAGLAVVPGAVATTIVAVPAGRLADRYGHRAVIVPGCLLYVLGMAVVRGAGDEPDFLGTWLPAMALNGAGLGLALPTLAAWALRDVAPERLASASAVQAAFRQFGGVLGTAALFAAGAPVTLAAAEDAYIVSTIWALGAGIVAASRSPLPLGAVVVTGVLVLAAPAAADTNVVVDFETGPALDTPITTQYQQSAFVSFNQADGYRPYRKQARRERGGQHRRRPVRARGAGRLRRAGRLHGRAADAHGQGGASLRWAVPGRRGAPHRRS